MAFPKPRYPALPTEIVSSPDVVGGRPRIAGTRIPAEVIVVPIRAGLDDEAIFRHDPGLPVEGIDAVRAWAASNGFDLTPDAAGR